MDEAPEIEEMSVPDSAYFAWKGSQQVETFGLCDCGHEGLGPGWHIGDCRGAHAATSARLRLSLRDLYEQWERAHLHECCATDESGLCPVEADPDEDYMDAFKQGCRWPLPKCLQF
jgi:hypothetical protein